MDIGTKENYIKANLDHLNKDRISISPHSVIADSVKMEGYCVIGRNCILEDDVELKRSILWDNVHVKRGLKIEDSIVTFSRLVQHNLFNQVY
jgi:mannose-1-phosphate guanylyltransferase/phosphomannomutase